MVPMSDILAMTLTRIAEPESMTAKNQYCGRIMKMKNAMIQSAHE